MFQRRNGWRYGKEVSFMRKIVFLLVLTVVFGLNIAAVSAYSEDEFSSIQTRQAGSLYTVITDIEGEEHRIDGVIDAKINPKNTIIQKDFLLFLSKNKNPIIANNGIPKNLINVDGTIK